MTRRTNARVAGATFLLYILIGVSQMIISRGAYAGADIAARLQSVASHTAQVKGSMLLGLVVGFVALLLAISLYGLTRDEDRDLALFAMVCRVAESLLVVVPIFATLALLDIAAASRADAHAVAELLMRLKSWNVTIAALLFSVGSLIFTWLFLRGRLIPRPLALLGIFASLLLVIALPLRLAELVSGSVINMLWLPMAAFEIPLGIWLIARGVYDPH
jgi:hypothetical protein